LLLCSIQFINQRKQRVRNNNIQCGPKIGTISLYALTLPNINLFSKLFHCQNHEKICNNAIIKDPITPQMCRYTFSILKATIDNNTISVTTNNTF